MAEETEKKTSLTPEDEILLAELLGKLEGAPGLPKTVFHALLRMSVSVSIEFVALNEKNEVLMAHRDDPEYPDCHHVPGTVLRNNETTGMAIKRLLNGELRGARITRIFFTGDHAEVTRGTGHGQNPTRHEIAIRVIGFIEGEYAGEHKFFSMNDLPPNTLSHHIDIIHDAERWLGRNCVAL